MRRGLILWSVCGVAVVLLALLADGCGPATGPAAQVVPLNEQMRALPTEAQVPFIRKVLVCGPFYASEPATSAPAASRPATRPAEGDFLAELGGEAAARPAAGQKVHRADGTEALWSAREFPTDNIDLSADMPKADGRKITAYAYATVPWPKDGPALLHLRARCDLKAYCNGHPVPAAGDVKNAARTGLYLPVHLAAGDNAVLVRIESGTGNWPVAMRVMNPDQVRPEDLPALIPAVKWSGKEHTLEIATDTSGTSPGTAVEVTVLAPAGKVMDKRDVARGDRLHLDASTWPDGPYEVRFSMADQEGRTESQYLPCYKGNPMPAVRKVLQECASQPADSDDPVVLKKRLIGQVLALRLGGDSARAVAATTQPVPPAAANRITAALMEYQEVCQESPQTVGRSGFYRLAWRDEVDGSPQFAGVFLPRDYDPARKYPLVVYLHGYDGRNPDYATKESGVRHERLAEEYDVLYMTPFGRGNTGYQDIGEADVMRAVALARKTLSVDADRIYLTGASMGGGGCWHVGTRHTDVFAAIAPIYGGWDYHAATREEQVRKVSAWPPQRRTMEDLDSSFFQAECLLNTPVFVNHGDSDELVPVANSRYAVRMLQRWGYDVRYWEHPGKGHGNLGPATDDAIVQWFLQHTLQRAPRHVVMRSPDLFGADAHWVHAEQQENPFAALVVDAHVYQDSVIRLSSENTLQIRLNPPRELIDPAGLVKVVWNGEPAYHGAIPPDGQITLRAPGYTPGPRDKKAIGPTPFAIVVGTTSKDERTRRFCRLLAERMRDDWKTWQHVTPRYFTDTEITDPQIRAYSLILFGGPEDNAVTARLSKDIPLKVEPNMITVDGRTFDVTDAAVRLVYPHPLNADRGVTIITGNSADGLFRAATLPDNVDFVIEDGRIGPEDDYFKNVVAWGRFDCHWRLDDKYLTAGDPSARARAPRSKVPKFLSVAVPDPRLGLSDVLATTTCGSFDGMMRDWNWQGKPLRPGGRAFSSGIAVQCRHEPCKATYDLSGGNWKHFRATIGIEVDTKPADITPLERQSTGVVFVVRGDGKELYKSPAFGVDSKALDLDVDISAVKQLELEVTNVARWHNIASSVDWADARLEK